MRVTAKLVADHWESMLREAAEPVMVDATRLNFLISDAGAAFSYSKWLAGQPGEMVV